MVRSEAILSLIFLILYSVNLSILIFGYATRRIVFKSVYTFLLLHVVLRLAAQSVGLVLGVRGFNVGVLIAYFVLGAEGYFSLVSLMLSYPMHLFPSP
jgi:hypothetical protein